MFDVYEFAFDECFDCEPIYIYIYYTLSGVNICTEKTNICFSKVSERTPDFKML